MNEITTEKKINEKRKQIKADINKNPKT